MHTTRHSLTCSPRPRLTLLLGVGLLATSRLSAALVPDGQELGKTPAATPAVETATPSTTRGAPDRDLILSVTALLGVLVGMERLATWRVGVRHRRGTVDVASALAPSLPGSSAPEISPVAWRTVLPPHRSSHFPRTIPG